MLQNLYFFLQYALAIKRKLTFHNFTSEPAAIAANDDDPLVLNHHSCMFIPILAGNGIDMKVKVIRYFIQPQGCVLSPFILATAPRDARSPGAPPRSPTACH